MMKRPNKLVLLWKLIRPNLWTIVTGVFLYGIIGITYPTMSALVGEITAVSLQKHRY